MSKEMPKPAITDQDLDAAQAGPGAKMVTFQVSAEASAYLEDYLDIVRSNAIAMAMLLSSCAAEQGPVSQRFMREALEAKIVNREVGPDPTAAQWSKLNGSK